MQDNSKLPSYLSRTAHGPSYLGDAPASAAEPEGEGEESCPAFGFLRGIRERALAVEFRLRSGNSEWLSYSCLVSFRHDPSAGLLLKFTGDVVTLVLISGSNLDAAVGQGMVNLTDRGLQRHRVVFVREMDESELRQVGESGPTIDRIDIADFETADEQREWLKTRAPAFVRTHS